MKNISDNLDIICICIGSFKIGIAATALIGLWLKHVRLYDWTGNGSEGMAANTALCVILAGVCLILIGRRYRREVQKK